MCWTRRQLVPSLLSRLVPGYLRVTRTNRIYTSPDEARKHIEKLRIRPRRFGPPRRLRPDVSVSVNHRVGWAVYTLTPKGGQPRGAVVYVHGGAWVNQIALQHWQLVAQIAAEARMSVAVPIYPLVPFGTAAEVVPAVADLVRTGTARHGSACLAGDSAGGQIALSAAVLLRDHQHTVPRTVLISPALDLSLDNPEIDRVQPSDPWLGVDGIRVFVEYWRDNLAISDPLVSPLAADLTGLGPLTVFSGTRDILNPDTRLLIDKATTAGIDVEYHEEEGLVHVYPLTPTPEGRAARAILVEHLRAAQPDP
jgi:acetyl esterase/lipase